MKMQRHIETAVLKRHVETKDSESQTQITLILNGAAQTVCAQKDCTPT